MSSKSAVTVNLVITSLSFLGSIGIIVGYWRGAAGGQRLRQRLVLGLGICDLVQSLDVLIGSSLHLAGRRFATNSPGCNFIGFTYQTCVVVSAAWTLTIAVVTYSTLVRPMSRLTMAIESPRAFYWIWAIVWSLGLIPAIFGTIFFAMTDVGGICWYTNGSMQSKLMIFVPRAIALVGVIGLYSSLFIFFRRRDMSLLATTSQGEDEEQAPVDRRLSLASVSQKLSTWGRRASATSRATIHTNHSYTSNHQSPLSPNVLSPPLSPIPQSPRPDFPSRGSQSVTITFPSSNNHRGEESDSAASTGEFPEISSFSGPSPTSKTVTPKRGSVHGAEEHVQLASYGNGAMPTVPAPAPTAKRLSPRQVNKRLSLLMMLYPIAYLLLFSVSVGRLTATLITSAPTHPALTHIARWLVLGQGLVDGVLYFVIEYLFRRSTRGRT